MVTVLVTVILLGVFAFAQGKKGEHIFLEEVVIACFPRTMPFESIGLLLSNFVDIIIECYLCTLLQS